jgi:hypothetical protein
MRYASLGKRCPASQIRNILDVVRTHNACVIRCHIDEKLVQLDVLLAVSVDEVVVLKPRDRQHWLSIQFRVIKTVQQMNAARTGSGEAHPELSSVFRLGARHECGSFFVANLNEPNLIRALSKRLHNSVDAVNRQSKHDLDARIVDRVDENISGCGFHRAFNGAATPRRTHK